MVNFSFARMRKKYIEDNDEQDPALIEKVAPFYQRTSQIIGGTQVSFVLCSAVLGISLLALVSHSLILSESLLGWELWAEWKWGVYAFLALLVMGLLLAYWVGTILLPGAHALVDPLPILASHTWVIRLNRHLYRLFVAAGLFVTHRIFRLRGIPFRNEVNFTYTEDEIRCIVEESHRSGRLNALENTLIKNSFDFFDLMARDVMIPRNEIVVFHFDEDLSEAMRRVLPKSHHTCYPVCIEDRDQIIGFIHVKDLLQGCLSGQLSLKKINREILTVPEVMPAPALLQLMKNRRIYLEVVVD